MDVETREVVLSDLSMPHSPRWHNGRLWLLDSGTRYFGYVDMEAGRFERVAFCPEFTRGLSISGDFTVIGLSGPRKDGSFSGVQLDDELKKRDATPHCGLQVVDLRTGDVVHWLRFSGVI